MYILRIDGNVTSLYIGIILGWFVNSMGIPKDAKTDASGTTVQPLIRRSFPLN